MYHLSEQAAYISAGRNRVMPSPDWRKIAEPMVLPLRNWTLGSIVSSMRHRSGVDALLHAQRQRELSASRIPRRKVRARLYTESDVRGVFRLDQRLSRRRVLEMPLCYNILAVSRHIWSIIRYLHWKCIRGGAVQLAASARLNCIEWQWWAYASIQTLAIDSLAASRIYIYLFCLRVINFPPMVMGKKKSV